MSAAAELLCTRCAGLRVTHAFPVALARVLFMPLLWPLRLLVESTRRRRRRCVHCGEPLAGHST